MPFVVGLSETPVSGMKPIIDAMGDAFSLVGTTLTKIMEQPLLLFLLAASVIPVVVGIFLCLKNASRG